MATVLQSANNRDKIATITADPSPPPDAILISRRDLETEHRQLLSRLHQLRRLLGYPELQTSHKRRS